MEQLLPVGPDKKDFEELADHFATLPDDYRVSYNALIDGVAISRTETNYNTYQSRNIGAYSMLVITPIIGGYVRESAIIPVGVFQGFASTGTSLNYTSGGVSVEVVIKYKTTTQFTMKYNASADKDVVIRIDAFKLTANS